VLTRITLVGALYLIIISFIPECMITGIHLNHLWGPMGRFFENLPNWVTNGLGVTFYFGGTSLLIVVRSHGYGDADRSAIDHAAL